MKWSLSGHDADLFCIGNGGISPDFDRGELRFKASPDYEDPRDAGRNNRYEVTVIATDGAGNTASRDVTVTVTNEDDPGMVILSSEQPQDGIDLTAKLTDPDGASGSTPPLNAKEMTITGITWMWDSAVASDCSQVNESTWQIIDRANAKSATYRPVLADVDDCLRATASYTDGHGAQNSAAMGISQSGATEEPSKPAPCVP